MHESRHAVVGLALGGMLEFVEAGDDVCCTRWVFTPWQPPGLALGALGPSGRLVPRLPSSLRVPPPGRAHVDRCRAAGGVAVCAAAAVQLWSKRKADKRALWRSLLVTPASPRAMRGLEEGEEADEGDKWNDLTVAFYKAALIVGKGPPPRAKVRALVGEAEKWAERILEHNKGAVLKLAKSLAMRQPSHDRKAGGSTDRPACRPNPISRVRDWRSVCTPCGVPARPHCIHTRSSIAFIFLIACRRLGPATDSVARAATPVQQATSASGRLTTAGKPSPSWGRSCGR